MPLPFLSLHDPETAAGHYARGIWAKDTLYAIAARHNASCPDAPAYRDRFRRLSWRQAVNAADRLADDLALRGVVAGQRVVFWMPDRIETAVVMLACSRAGFVACPSPHRNHTVAEVADMISRLRAAAFLYQPGYGADARIAGREDAIMDAAAAISSVRHIYRIEPVSRADADREMLARELDSTSRGGDLPAAASNPDRVSYIAFTSGSTGQPKGVMHSDNTLLVTARALVRDWRIGAGDVVCTLSPFSHNLGVGAMLTALVAGAELVMHDTPRGESIAERLAEIGATYIVGVPTHAIDLIEDLRKRGKQRLGKVRAFRVSGAACPPHVMHDLVALGIEPQSGYGMTENNSHQYTRPGDAVELVAGSCGRACEGYEVGIFDSNHRDRRLEIGESGLVGGRGACTMLGYFGDQAATEAAFNADGWFLTGDIGKLDVAGYLKLTGRLKELLIRGGHNISPARIEDLASSYPGVVRAAVLAVPDERLGERICLAITGPTGVAIEGRKLNAHLAQRGLSRYELPEYLLELAEMPMMANGKIDKPALLGAVVAGKLKPTPID